MTLIEFINALDNESSELQRGDVVCDFLKRKFDEFKSTRMRSEILFGCLYIAFQQAAMKRSGAPQQYSLSICSSGGLMDSVGAACDSEASPIRFVCPELIDVNELSLATQMADLRPTQMHKIVSQQINYYAKEYHKIYQYKSICNLSLVNISGLGDFNNQVSSLGGNIGVDASILCIYPDIGDSESIFSPKFKYKDVSDVKKIVIDEKKYIIQSFIYGE